MLALPGQWWAANISETSVNLHQTVGLSITDGRHLHTRLGEKLKFRNILQLLA
jgi:hypothetical protein